MNIQIFKQVATIRLPEEPNGSLNWPPIMKIKIVQLRMSTKQKQEETLGLKQRYNTF